MIPLARSFPSLGAAIAILCASLPALGAPEEPLLPSFVDAWHFGETSAYGQQTVALSSTRPDCIQAEPAYRGSPRYGLIRLGSSPAVEIPLVVDFTDEPGEAAPDVYVDGDRDGRIGPEEKAITDPSAPTPLATASTAAIAVARTTLPIGDARVPFERTIAVQVDAFGVVAIVMPRGFCAVALGDQGPPAQVVLIDRDGDGVLALDGNDGVLPLTPGADGQPVPGDVVRLRRVTNLAGRVVELVLDPLGTTLTVRPRPDAAIPVTPRVSMAEPATIDHVAVLVIGEDGSMTRVGRLDEPISMQVGAYRIASCSLSVTDSVGTGWSYLLAEGAAAAPAHEVSNGPGQEWDLAGEWSVEIETAASTVNPGQDVSAVLKISSRTGLEMHSCRSGLDGNDVPVAAEVRLVNAAGTEVARAAGGYG